MSRSIFFRVKQCMFDPHTSYTNAHPELVLRTFPLQTTAGIEAQGLCFYWYFTINVQGREQFYYSSEEYFYIPENALSDIRILSIINQSFNNVTDALTSRTKTFGIELPFPVFSDWVCCCDLQNIQLILQRQGN